MVSQNLYIAAGCKLAAGPTGMLFTFIQLDEGAKNRTPCMGCGFKTDCTARAVIEPQEKKALNVR